MSRKKENNNLTFMIVPHGKSKTISLQFSLHKLRILGYLFVFASVIGVYLLADYVRMHVSQKKLESESLALQQKLAAMDQKLAKEKNEFATLMDQVNEMKSYVQQLETLEMEIRNKSGSLLLPSDGAAGSGGAERVSLDSPVIEQELDSHEMIKITSDTLLSLEREVPEKIKNAKHLLQDVDAMNRKLIHTPSIYPAIGRITSRFGNRADPFHGATRFHDGFDIAGYYRSPIYATADGKVVFAARNQGYGKTVQIVHSKKLQTSYSHLSEIIVSVGDSVKKGQIIGYMGSTGRSTGVHVHYMVYENGRPVDPEKYLPTRRR